MAVDSLPQIVTDLSACAEALNGYEAVEYRLLAPRSVQLRIQEVRHRVEFGEGDFVPRAGNH